MLVSWDDYSQYMESHKNDPNHQPALDPLTSHHVIIIIAAG
jgi:hypothetical protein